MRNAFQLFHTGLGEPAEAFAGVELLCCGGGHGVQVRKHALITGVADHALVREVDALIEILLDARQEKGPQHQGVIACRC